MSVRIRWAPDARERILNHEGVTEAVNDLAVEIVREVEQFAPAESGEYVRGIEIVEHVDADGIKGRVVRATDAKSALIEYGSGPRETEKGAARGEMPAYHVLTRAAEAAALLVKPAP